MIWKFIAHSIHLLTHFSATFHCILSGKRQNNTNQQRADSYQLKGYRFFADDEDQFGLEDILQAVMFMKSSTAFVPAKPWQHGVMGKTIQAIQDMSKEAQTHLSQMVSVE